MKHCFSAVMLVSIMVVSCKKEQTHTNAINSSSVSELSATDSILKAISPGYILGEYSSRGSRTVYDGEANDNGDNIKLILDFFATKTMTVAPDKKHLTIPFGEGKYTSRGWAYIIGYDFKKHSITVEPNDIMKREIQLGSFEALYATYDPQYQSWTFQTRFIALDDHGNESEVIEPMGK